MGILCRLKPVGADPVPLVNKGGPRKATIRNGRATLTLRFNPPLDGKQEAEVAPGGVQVLDLPEGTSVWARATQAASVIVTEG